MDPQSTIHPTNQYSDPATSHSSNQPINQSSGGGHGIAILSMTIFILLSLAAVAFLYYQNQELKGMLAGYQTPAASPTPTATDDPTAGWKTYTNSQIGFSFEYPSDWILKDGSGVTLTSYSIYKPLSDGDVEPEPTLHFFVAYHKGVTDLAKWLTDNQAGEIVDTVKINGNKFSKIKGGSLEDSLEYATQISASGILRIVIEPYPNKVVSDETFNQILSTFKFIEDTTSAIPTPVQKACTLEAKICPDGSSVGRTGPNCEFAPCPTE